MLHAKRILEIHLSSESRVTLVSLHIPFNSDSILFVCIKLCIGDLNFIFISGACVICRFLFDENCTDFKYYQYRLAEEEKALSQNRDSEFSSSGQYFICYPCSGYIYFVWELRLSKASVVAVFFLFLKSSNKVHT